jgi:hypothetical protein
MFLVKFLELLIHNLLFDVDFQEVHLTVGGAFNTVNDTDSGQILDLA